MKFRSEELQDLKDNIEERENNIYDEKYIEEKVYNDEIEPEEEAFMRGYLDATA